MTVTIEAQNGRDRRNSPGMVRVRRGFVGLLAAAVLGLGAFAVPRGPLEEFNAARAARQWVAARRFDLALPAAERWVRVNPDSAEAHCLRARALFELAHYDEAGKALDRAQWLGHAERPIYRIRALMLARSHRYVEAEPILLNLLNESSEPEPELDEALTHVFLETYRLELAVKVIKRWIHDAPRDPRPYLCWAEVDFRIEVDNPESMERHYRTALELSPDLDRARLGLADTLRHLHRNVEAAGEYATYLARRPRDVAGHLGLARIAVEEADEASALVHMERALEIDPRNAEVLKLRATIDSRHGDDLAALRHLDRAVQSDPTDLDALYARLLALTRLGRTQEAAEEKRRADQLRKDQLEVVRIRDRLIADPNNNDIRFELARWMLDHGRPEETMRWLRTILAQQPKHVPSLRLLARYHDRTGEIGLANYYRAAADSAR